MLKRINFSTTKHAARDLRVKTFQWFCNSIKKNKYEISKGKNSEICTKNIILGAKKMEGGSDKQGS